MDVMDSSSGSLHLKYTTLIHRRTRGYFVTPTFEFCQWCTNFTKSFKVEPKERVREEHLHLRTLSVSECCERSRRSHWSLPQCPSSCSGGHGDASVGLSTFHSLVQPPPCHVYFFLSISLSASLSRLRMIAKAELGWTHLQPCLLEFNRLLPVFKPSTFGRDVLRLVALQRSQQSSTIPLRSTE